MYVQGGDEAIERVANWNLNKNLQNVWLATEYTRLRETPEILAAAIKGGMSYPAMRRLDNALQAERATKVGQILDNAGIDRGMMDPRTTSIAAARKAAVQRKAQVEAESNWFTDSLSWVWDRVVDAGEGLMTGLGEVWELVRAPFAAGQAQFGEDVESTGIPLVDFVMDPINTYVAGWSNIIGGGLKDTQKEDMRRAGYDPDSWTDRYGWYADLNDTHAAVNERVVNEAKNEFNPHKVDLVRELVTLGVADDPRAAAGASEDAQRLYEAIKNQADPEATKIVEKLSDQRFGPGAEIANSVKGQLDLIGVETDRSSGWYKATEIVGDLAVGWYAGPEVLAAKGFNAWRNSRWLVDMHPEQIQDAIINGKGVSTRWNQFLDGVDNVYVLEKRAEQTGAAEDVVAATRRFRDLSRKHHEMMPLYEAVAGMRSGKIAGTFFRKDVAPTGKERGLEDLKQNLIGLNRVDDLAKQRPQWSLRENPGDEITDEARNAARVAIAEKVGDAVAAVAIVSNQPLVKRGKMLLPGQIRVSHPVRVGLAKFTDALTKTDKRLLDQLKAGEGGVVNFTRAIDPDVSTLGVLNAKGGEWVQDNYIRGGGWRARAARTLSKFSKFDDAPILKFDGIDTTAAFHDFIRPFLPKGQAAFLANRWATADPATRSVMANNMWTMLESAIGVTKSKGARDFWDQQLKEWNLPQKAGGSQKTAYSEPSKDLIRVGDDQVAAGMYSTQFADGVQLPNYVEMLRNSQRVGIFAHIFGWGNSAAVSRMSRSVKVAWVGTLSNMMRQVLEARALQLVEHPISAMHTSLARVGLAGRKAGERDPVNQSFRQAKELLPKSRELTALHNKGDFVAYADKASALVRGKISPPLYALLKEGVAIDTIAAGRSNLRLRLTQFSADPVRRQRAKLYGAIEDKARLDHADNWGELVDTRASEEFAKLAHKIDAKARHNYAIEDALDQIQEATAHGLRLQKANLTNTYGYMGAAGDTGALAWAHNLGLRLSDPVGQKVGQLIARLAADDKRALVNATRDLAKAHPDKLDEIANINNVRQYAAFLLKRDQAGQSYRLNGRRAQYDADGAFIRDPAARDGRLDQWGSDLVDDMVTYLGLKRLADTRDIPAKARQVYQKIAKGETVTVDDLARIPEHARPDQVITPILVPKGVLEDKGSINQRMAGWASKWYDMVVARPLQRLSSDPQAIAAHREMMDTLEPLAHHLVDKRGMSQQSAYNLLQSGAWAHAISRVSRYTDHPATTTYFSVNAGNFLFFERAMEDFLRRAMRITKADPAVLGRAHVMAEAAVHSGLVYKQTGTDEDGEPTTQHVFTFPGSGLMMRAVQEGMESLGIVEDGVLAPTWTTLTAPVKYLSPSLQNPLGFTTTPMIGIPMRAVRQIFPETGPGIDKAISIMEGGGEVSASGDWSDGLIPVPLRRIWRALEPDDREGQVASSMRNAMIYHQAAGLMPGPDAPDHERQKYMDSLRATVQAQLITRAIMGNFLPAAPRATGAPGDIGGEDDVNIFDRMKGVENVRSEWFQVLEQHGGDIAAASDDFLKRGRLTIVDQGAFTVGSSGDPYSGKSFPSNKPLTQWMLDNQGFLDKYGHAAYALLPSADGPWYDGIGYRIQLRAGLREHKTPDEMYNALVVAQTNREWFTARDEANKRFSPEVAKKMLRRVRLQMEAANPVWATKSKELSSPAYVNNTLAPMIRQMVEDPDLPAELAGVRDELAVLADLYDSYSAARNSLSSSGQRISLANAYKARGESLFLGGPVSDLWNAMKVWED